MSFQFLHFLISNNSATKNSFTVREDLGRGAFGKVVRCVSNLRGEVAVKVEKYNEGVWNVSENEIEILQKVEKFSKNP